MTVQPASPSPGGTGNPHSPSGDVTKTEVHCVHDERPAEEKRTVNAFLILTCVIFSAASLLFGFDDKIISPVASLEPFVSGPSLPIYSTKYKAD
jgi:hypothetical protein